MTNEEKQAENIKDVLENGPGLRKSHHHWIVAKDPEPKRVLRGGLGGFGVGQMWGYATETELQSEEYAQAPCKDSFMGWGTSEEWMLKERGWTVVDGEGHLIAGAGGVVGNILREFAVLKMREHVAGLCEKMADACGDFFNKHGDRGEFLKVWREVEEALGRVRPRE